MAKFELPIYIAKIMVSKIFEVTYQRFLFLEVVLPYEN